MKENIHAMHAQLESHVIAQREPVYKLAHYLLISRYTLSGEDLNRIADLKKN